MNRMDAMERLVALIRQAATPPVPRKATRPTGASRRRRIEAKQHRAATKRHRQRPPSED
jgi:ribosome-associated protein